MRVAGLYMKRDSSKCPLGLRLNITIPHTCRQCSYKESCSSNVYHVSVSYSRICRRVIGYQVGSPDVFPLSHSSGFDGNLPLEGIIQTSGPLHQLLQKYIQLKNQYVLV